MTDATDERPFYEQARASRVVHPPASRLPVYLICAAAFVVGVIAFFVGGLPDDARGSDLGRTMAYLLGYKLGSQLVYAAVIGAAGTVFLSTTEGRKLNQRTGGEDFLWPFLSALAGGVAAIALIVAIAVPTVDADRTARSVMATQTAAISQAALDFDRDVAAISNGQGILSPESLSADPGYRRTAGMIERVRLVVSEHRKRQADLIIQGRRNLAAAIDNPGQRRRILAEYDTVVAREAPLLARYWALQEESADQLSALLGVLKTSPHVWRGGQIYFSRTGDLTRFRTAQIDGEQGLVELENIRRQLRSGPPAPAPAGR
jgi:hypothetical protein